MTASRLVLVTGASGALGRLIVPALQNHGWRVRALVRRRQVLSADESATGDLADFQSLRAATGGVDAVVHLAALTHARKQAAYDAVNVEGTRRLLAAAAESGAERFLHVSTRAIDETGGAYSRSKRAAERLVQASDIAWTIVRLPEVYGMGSSEGVDDIVRRARRGARIPIVGDGSDTVCPIHADDATAALVAALSGSAGIGKVYTLAGDCRTTREFAEVCIDVFGVGGGLVRVPASAVRLLGAAARVAPLPLYPDQLARLRAPKPAISVDAERDLGFRPRRLEDGLRRLPPP